MAQASPSHLSLAEQAYQALEEQLVTLRLAPGTRVLEKELAAATGLGRTPVREAVQRLSAQGILQVLPRKGLMVSPVSRRELVQILEVRRVLERLLVIKAAERATPDQQRALQALAAHLERLKDDPASFMRLDRRLDEILAEACGNPHLVKALSSLHVHCRRIWYMNLDRVELASATAFHGLMAGAVADGDGAGAVRALNGIIAILEGLVAEVSDNRGR